MKDLFDTFELYEDFLFNVKCDVCGEEYEIGTECECQNKFMAEDCCIRLENF